jgi:hypothetical protein
VAGKPWGTFSTGGRGKRLLDDNWAWLGEGKITIKAKAPKAKTDKA